MRVGNRVFTFAWVGGFVIEEAVCICVFIIDLVTDDDKDADGNEEDTSQDLLLHDEIGHDDEDEIPIGHTTTPILNDFEGLERFRLELSKKFDSII